jgi:hypothetical protein
MSDCVHRLMTPIIGIEPIITDRKTPPDFILALKAWRIQVTAF